MHRMPALVPEFVLPQTALKRQVAAAHAAQPCRDNFNPIPNLKGAKLLQGMLHTRQ